MPLRARVGDAQRAALRCVFDGVLDGARRQGIECVGGTATTLWTFFKTLELWRDGLLAPEEHAARQLVIGKGLRARIAQRGAGFAGGAVLHAVVVAGELLRGLVASRLLHTEARGGNTYYELSHDALIEPVLAPRRFSELLTGWLQVGAATALLTALALLAAMSLASDVATNVDHKAPFTLSFGLGIVVQVAIVVALARFVLRWSDVGMRRVLRFSRRGDATPGRISHSSKRRGLLLISARLNSICVAAYHLTMTVTLLYYSSSGKVTPWRYHNPQHWEILTLHGITAMGIDGAAWLAFDLLAPVLATKWCTAGLRRLIQSDQPGGGDTALPLRRSRGDLLIAALSGLIALPMLVEQVMILRCRFVSDGTLPASFPSSWYWNLAEDCASRVPHAFFARMFLPDLTAPCILVAAVIYFLRRRPAVASPPKEPQARGAPPAPQA